MMTVSFMTLFYSMVNGKNTIDTLYMTYNIYCNYCGIFLSPARKIMSTCQMIVYM